MSAASRGLFCFVALVALIASPLRAEDVENPEYKSWSKHKPETMVKMKTSTEAAGQKTNMEMTNTLVEVTPDKLVVETKTSIEAGGQKMEMPAQKRDVPAKIATATPTTPPPPTEAADKPEVKSGEETLKLGDKEVKCKWTETTMKQGDQTTVSKTWTAEEIPGTTAKMESKTTNKDGATAMSVVMEVVEFTTK